MKAPQKPGNVREWSLFMTWGYGGISKIARIQNVPALTIATTFLPPFPSEAMHWNVAPSLQLHSL